VEQWQAKWIWVHGQEKESNVYVETRKRFELQGKAERAALKVTANQFYKLLINGTEVGRGPAPSDNKWKYYDTYEVAEYLQRGDNVIALIAYNFGTETIVTQQLQGPGGLLLQLDLVLEGEGTDLGGSIGTGTGTGIPMTIATGEDWKCRRSRRWHPKPSRQHKWRGFREIYLAQEEDGWEQVSYDDTDWPDAHVVAAACQPDSSWPRLLPRDIPPLKESIRRPSAVVASEAFFGFIVDAEALLEEQEQRVLSVDASVPGSFPQITYDFEREVVGYPELTVEAPEGGVVQLFYGESLELELTDTFILKKGLNRLSPFARRAFRFIKLAVQATPQPIAIKELTLRFVHYPFPEQGSFRSSDELLNRIWETGKYTTLVNSQNHFEDCPHREQALWVADAVVMAKVVYQTFGDAAIVRKSLLQSARIQHEAGSIAGTGPEYNPFTLPDFCAHWLFGVHEYWSYSGDTAFLDEVWPHVVKLSEWFAEQEDASGLFARADRQGWWCFIDWSDDIERQDRVTAISCFYYKYLRLTAELSLQMGERERAAALQEKAERLRNAIRSLLRDPSSGYYADCLTDNGLSASITAQTNFAAIWSGVTDDAEAERFIREVYLPGKLPSIKGAFFYHIVLETLFRYGFADEAIAQIRAYWGDMLERGATTWWETFDPSLPFCTIPSPYQGHTPTYLQDAIPVSHSHGWGASPTNLLTSEILGVDALTFAGNENHVFLRPRAAGDLTWAEGTIPTSVGDIQAKWESNPDDSFRFEALLPQGISWEAVDLREVQVQQKDGGTQVTAVFGGK